MRHLALPLLLIQLLMLTSAPLPGQTTVRKLFNRAYQFDPNGLTSQTAVQPFEELPSSSFSWGKNGLSHYGNRFYAAYARRPHTNTFIFLKTSPDGTTWSNPVQVSDSLGVSGASYPSVAFWGDPALPNICIVYTDVFPGGAELRATVSSDGGQSFSPSVRIDDHAGVTNILPDLAIDDAGTLYVSWNRSVGSNWYTTYFSSSSDGGQTWSPQITVHTGRVFSYPSRIVARGNGEVLIGICDDQNSKSNLVVYTSNNSGDSWQLATQATNYAFSHGFRWFSVMKDAADNVHFVHPYYENGIVQEVRHINSNDWGSSWSSVHSMSDPSLVPLQNGANQRNMPYLTFTQQGNLYAAWADHRNDPAGNEYEVYLTRSLDGGLSWAPEVQVNIPDNVQEHSYPILAATGDGNRDTLSIIWSQVYNLAGGNPPNPFNLVGPADQSVFATSTIFFSWQQSSDPDGDPVSYSLRIWEMSNPAADTTISGISGTNRGFDGAGFLRAGRSYSWTVEASDGQNTTPSLDIFTFSLLPSDFAVFPEAPANGSQLADSQAPVEFRWRSEITRASGPLTYTLHITGTEGDTSITAISDTTFSFDGSTFFEGSRGYCWAVEASDGSASVTSATFSLFTPAGVMGGIYRIGPCGDFPDIDGAIGALNAYGNHQPTTLRIAPGIYPLSAVLAAPSGISGDPVVFESENGDPQSVEIRHAAANGNFMLQINGYPNVSFRQLHFHSTSQFSGSRFIVQFLNSPGSSVDSCIFSGQTFPASFSAAVYANLCPDFRVSGNVFQDLDNAVSIFGEPVSSTTPGLLIENNQIAVPERSGIFIVAMSAPVVRGNRITSQSAYPVIDLVDCINGTQVTGNYIRQTPGEQRDPAVGLQLFDCQGNGERALLANNMILSTANDSLSNTIGIYLFSSSSVDVVFNNVHIRGDNHPNDPGTGYALLASQNADDLRLFNNHLTVTQHGYAYALLSPNLQIADYNLLHSASNFLVQTGGTTYFTLEQLQQATGQESHSLAVPPQYRALDDLHLAGRFADGAGLPFAGIATDIDGEPRDPQSPDIGADEYSPMDAGMSGTFSIGADNADFEDFSAAIQHLHMLGINGPVTFAIQSGLYTEKIYLPEFAGSSPARRITFRSASGRPQDVELRYLPQPQGFGGMVQFDRADYITLGQLTFAGQLDGGISKPILAIQRGSVGISLVQNRFIPDPGPANAVMLFTQGDSASAADSLVITGNTFIGGKISIRGSESRGLQSLRFSGNRFSLDDDSQYAMDVQYVTDFDLSNNLIVLTNQRQSTTGFSGVLVSGTSGDLLVSGNRFQVDGARRIGALNIYHHQDGGSPGRVNNNFISVRADSQHYGIYVEDSRLEIDFNSVYLTGGSATNRQSRGSAIVIEKTLSDPRVPRLRNNIFANRGGGFALYGNRLGNNFDSDYNDLYSTGSFLVRYNNASGAPVYYADLPGFRAATNLDRNSLSVSPRFASDTDLHLTDNQALNDAGIPLSRINRDIDRQQRNAATPDIGADEYSPGRGTIKIRGGISVRIPARQSVSDIFEVSLFPNKVADGYRLTDLNVGIDTLLVANVGDIDLILTHEGVSDTLVYNLSSGGSHFLNTLFDDSAAQAIDQGSAPFSGIFRPYGSLARFQGLDPEGDWELRIANSGEDTTGVLRGWRLDLAFEYVTGVGGEQPRVPELFQLGQNYPNPFNPGTTIPFALPEAATVRLEIYNVLGQMVVGSQRAGNLRRAGNLQPGYHTLTWDGTSEAGNPLPSGVYFYRLLINGQPTKTRKMLFVR